MRFEEEGDLWIWHLELLSDDRLSWGMAEVMGGSLGQQELSVRNACLGGVEGIVVKVKMSGPPNKAIMGNLGLKPHRLTFSPCHPEVFFSHLSGPVQTSISDLDLDKPKP